jgi:Tol biopolymer transport system component
MTLTPGSRLGPYEILSPLGAGGMGEVYRARDTRLGRDVAVKVLPHHLSLNAEVRARFEREAKTVSSLNHPNICTLFDVGREGDTDYLVMELIEGETLAKRLEKGSLPTEQVIAIGIQIADALTRAHRAGIVHRDLKPGNVMLTKGGAKLMDFGLARATGLAGESGSGVTMASLTQSPTVAEPLTAEGTIVGTFQYMSPEQLEGKEADARSDVWALGCVLYEMATGRRAFEGKSQASLITSIMGSQPAPLSQLAPLSPPGLDRLVQACLAKDPADRLQSAHDIRMQLAWLAEGGSQAGVPAPVAAKRRNRARLATMLAAAGWLVAIAAVAWIALQALRPVPSPTRFAVSQPDGVFMDTDGSSFLLSPDGRTLAFVASDSTGGSSIWLRPLKSTEARPIPGTLAARIGSAGTLVCWSPNSRQIAFESEEKLKRIAVAGGEAEVVCAVKATRGGSWGRNGVILIAPTSNGPIFRVSANGGEPQPVTTLDSTRGETAHRFPQFLPDGRHFLFTALPARDGKFITWVGSLDSPKRRILLSAGSGVTLAPGYLLYLRDGKLIAQGFDARAIKLRGEPVSLGDAVNTTNATGGPIVTSSETGTLAFGTYQPTNLRLAWVDLSGREIAPIPVTPGPYFLGSLSPDDRRLALGRSESSETSDLWIADLERGVATRFTDDPGDVTAPDWSPDGTRIAYMLFQNAPQVFKIKSLADNSVETFLASDPLFKGLNGWTPDGRSLIYGRLHPETQWDLWVLPMDGDHTPRPYLATRFNETGGRVSKDGRWMAYLSDESGQTEAYVQSYPVPGGKYQVTSGGASFVRWSQDGTHIRYGLRFDPRHVHGAEVRAGSEFRLGPPSVLATFPKDNSGVRANDRFTRFIALLPAGKNPTPSITVVLDGLPGGRR